MGKTEYLNFKSKFTLLQDMDNDETKCVISEIRNKTEKKETKPNTNSSIVEKTFIYTDSKQPNFNEHQSVSVTQPRINEPNKQLNNCSTEKLNNLILNNTMNETYSETYISEKYGLKHSNTFMMTFCQPTLCDYFKQLFGINSYEHDDYVQYSLRKKHYKEQEIAIRTITVAKNAFHCQDLAKKLIVVKDCNHVPKKIIFV